MIALMLGRRGLPVRLIERRDDMRLNKSTTTTTASASAPVTAATAASPIVSAGASAAAAEATVSGKEPAESGTERLANSAKRSINLALSYRGICALKHVNLYVSTAVAHA
jgi:hypothetical protein